MFFKHFYDEDLAQGSYLIGCQATGEAVVVDARRDIGAYLAEAARRGLEVTAVTETHIHADYLSGSRELAAATGALLEGQPDAPGYFARMKRHNRAGPAPRPAAPLRELAPAELAGNYPAWRAHQDQLETA